MSEQKFVYIDVNYLKELEEKAKKVDYYKGIIDGIDMVADRKTEPSNSEIPNNCEDLQDWKDRMWAEAIVTEPTTEDCSMIKDECKWYGDKQVCGRCRSRNLYAPKDEPTTQTETQNSNLTFEKRTMRDCYNCKRYETEGECIECKFEPKYEPQTERSE